MNEELINFILDALMCLIALYLTYENNKLKKRFDKINMKLDLAKFYLSSKLQKEEYDKIKESICE